MQVLVGIVSTVLLGVVAMAFHEVGHIVVAWLCGVKVKKVGVCWTGVYTMRATGPSWANFLISSAGPLVNLVLAIVLRSWMPHFAWVNLAAAIYNLLPIPNSDGSRILAILAANKSPARETPAARGWLNDLSS